MNEKPRACGAQGALPRTPEGREGMRRLWKCCRDFLL